MIFEAVTLNFKCYVIKLFVWWSDNFELQVINVSNIRINWEYWAAKHNILWNVFKISLSVF